MVGVLIVDDQPFFRGAARAVVSSLPGFCTVAEASSGRQALAVVDELRPDVVVDVRMPGMDGIQTTRQIKARRPETVVILVSVEEVDALPSSGRTAGAEALVHKREFGPALLRRVWATHDAR